MGPHIGLALTSLFALSLLDFAQCQVAIGGRRFRRQSLIQSVGPSGVLLSSTSTPLLTSSKLTEKFTVNKNSIIRTHDSRALGARYLNETDLPSNEDCLHWCWNTTACNLAVYEEKTRGSCYLFDCGPLDDFKCRFTGHSFYSSSVLQVNRNSYLLNEWKSQASQENDLNGLKTGNGPQGPSGQAQLKVGDDNSVNQSQGIFKSPSLMGNAASVTAKVSKCRHYQFECRNNSECIAIYNVCDGIPQCADGSDEAVELECHKSRLSASPGKGGALGNSAELAADLLASKVAAESGTKHLPGPLSGPLFKPSLEGAATGGDKLNYQQPGYLAYNYPRSPNEKMSLGDESSLLFGNRAAQLGSDYTGGGPGTAANPSFGLSPWNTQYTLPGDLYKSAPVDKLTFAGAPEVGDQFGGASPSLKDPAAGLYWPSFNYQTNADLQASLQQAHSVHQQQQQQQQQDLPVAPYSSLLAPDARNRASDDALRNLQPPGLPLYNRYFGANNPLAPFSGSTSNKAESQPTANGSDPKGKVAPSSSPSAVVKDPAPSLPVKGTSRPDYAHISASQSRVVSPGRPSIVAISHLRDTSPQNGHETNSAVIALTLGLLVTTILIVIVGCRMKSFKKRIARRGGRSLAHDADYLVNGMYL